MRTEMLVLLGCSLLVSRLAAAEFRAGVAVTLDPLLLVSRGASDVPKVATAHFSEHSK